VTTIGSASPSALVAALCAAAAAWLTAAAPALAQTRAQPPYRGPGMMGDGGWGGWLFGPLTVVLLVVAVVVLAVAAARWLGASGKTTGGPQPAHKTALDILKERYARGEIDSDEFREKRRLIEED
jgi:putative membrane protein